uniref:Uncharacterized protein n=1 Tax=Anopheles albimanus TaxID=7167 RepID=A0A182FZ76_ANOAL
MKPLGQVLGESAFSLSVSDIPTLYETKERVLQSHSFDSNRYKFQASRRRIGMCYVVW